MTQKKPQSPALFWVFMVAKLAIGALFYVQLGQSKDLQAEVLLQDPPAQVTVSEFDPSKHSNQIGEARIQAQLDLDMEFELIHEFKRKTRTAIMVALEPIEGSAATLTSTPTPAVMLVYGELDEAKVAWLLQNKVGDGALGPIINLHGSTQGDDANWGPLIAEVFADQGRPLAADPIILYPWFEPREAALTGLNPFGILAIFGVGAALFALLALRQGHRLRKWRRAQNGGAQAVGAAVDAAAGPLPATAMAAADYAPQPDDLPVGPPGAFVTITPYAPQMVDGSDGSVLMRKLLAHGNGRADVEVYSPEKPGLEAFEAIESGKPFEDPFAKVEARANTRSERLLGVA